MAGTPIDIQTRTAMLRLRGLWCQAIDPDTDPTVARARAHWPGAEYQIEFNALDALKSGRIGEAAWRP